MENILGLMCLVKSSAKCKDVVLFEKKCKVWHCWINSIFFGVHFDIFKHIEKLMIKHTRQTRLKGFSHSAARILKFIKVYFFKLLN